MSKKAAQKRPPKTLKERRFVKELPTAKDGADAVIKAGYNVKDKHSAWQIAYENLSKLDMTQHFYKAGLTHETLAQNTTRIALTAKKIWGTGDDFIEVEDNPTQLQAMKFASELMGLKQVEGSTTIVQPILTLEAD